MIVLAVGNDAQFRRFCDFAGRPELAEDPRFATNGGRLRHRESLTPLIADIIAGHPVRHWVDGLAGANVPCSPVQEIDQVFADPQVKARAMTVETTHPAVGGAPLPLIASPMKMSATPVSYRRPPPMLGEHNEEVLGEILGIAATEIAALRKRGVI